MSFPKGALRGATADVMSWITGSWAGTNGEDAVEEHWSPLRGGSLMGMFRWVRGDAVHFYELLVVEQDGDEVRLRIKHFDPKLVGWEERDRPHEFVLVRAREREAVTETGTFVYTREGAR
jgi:hypothetical protein